MFSSQIHSTSHSGLIRQIARAEIIHGCSDNRQTGALVPPNPNPATCSHVVVLGTVKLKLCSIDFCLSDRSTHDLHKHWKYYYVMFSVLFNVVNDPQNQHSKNYICVVLNMLNVFYLVTKSDLSYDYYRMLWSTESNQITKYCEIVWKSRLCPISNAKRTEMWGNGYPCVRLTICNMTCFWIETTHCK